MVAAHRDKALIGAGTVLTEADVAKVADAGGRLIVSPNTDPAVIAATRAHGMQSWPGVFTATEAFTAIKAGATGLKLFPGTLAGPDGLKALRAVLPSDMPVYAVGGAEPHTFAAWRAAGAQGIGLGGALYAPGMNAIEVADRAATVVAAWDKTNQETHR